MIYFTQPRLIRLKIVFVYFVAFICFSLSSVAAAGLSQSDRDLLKTFSDKCDEVDIIPEAFPDLYVSKAELIFCEVAKTFDPQNYGMKHALLHFGYAGSKDSIYSESLSALNAINQHYKIPSDMGPLDLERLLYGDPTALNRAVNDAQYSVAFRSDGQSVLSHHDITKLSKHFDYDLIMALFASDKDFLREYEDTEALLKLSDHLLSKAHLTNHQYLTAATFRIVSVLGKVLNQPNPSNTLVAGLIGHDLRLNLLSLNAMTRALSEDFDASLRIWEYGRQELMQHYLTGSSKSSAEIFYKYQDMTLISCARSVENVFQEISSQVAPLQAIACVQDAAANFPEAYQVFGALIDPGALEIARKFDFELFVEWIKNDGWLESEPDALYNRVFLASLRHIKFMNYDKYSMMSLISDMEKAEQLIRKFSSPIKRLDFLTNLSMTNPIDPSELISVFVEFSIDPSCDDLSLENCKAILRSIPFDAFDTNFLFISLGSGKGMRHQFDYNCAVPRYLTKVLERIIWAGGVPQTIQRVCPAEFFAQYSNDISIKNIAHLMTRISAFPHSAGINFLTNHSVWWEAKLGLIPAHWARSTYSDAAFALPPDQILEEVKNKPIFTLISEEILEQNFSFTSREKIDGFLENETDSYQAADYWINTISKAVLGEIYLESGRAELALLSTLGSLSQPISVIGDDERMPEYLRLKYTAKKAEIPKIFIDQLFTTRLQNTGLKNGEAFNALIAGMKEIQTTIDFADGADGFEYGPITNFAAKYLSDKKDIQDLDILFASSDSIIDNLGFIVNFSADQIKEVCTNDRYVREIIDFKNLLSDLSPKITNIFIDKTTLFEIYDFIFICSTTTNKLYSYQELVDSFIAAINNRANLATSTMQSFVVNLSKFAKQENAAVGTAVTLILTKYMFAEFTDAFIETKSFTLRKEQKLLEDVIYNSMHVIGNEELFEFNRDARLPLANTAILLGASRHFPVLTNKSYERLVGTGATVWTENNEKVTINEIYKHFDDKEIQLAKTDNPIDYVLSKAENANHTFKINIGPGYIASLYKNRLDKILEGKAPNDETLILNMFSNDDGAIINYITPSRFGWKAFRFLDGDLDPVKAALSNGRIDQNLHRALCENFGELHTFLMKELGLGETIHKLNIVPSVNLYPIPIPIIIGSSCGDKNVQTVVAGDIAAAFEATEYRNKAKFPLQFVGVGNPLPQQKNNFKISIPLGSKVSNREFKRDLMDNFSPLPDAAIEVTETAKYFSKKSIYLNQNASLIGAFEKMAELSKSSDTKMLVLASHGTAADYENKIFLPGLLSSNEGQLELILSAEIPKYNFENSMVLLSACDTAAGFVNKPDLMFTGLVQSFADARAEFILASWWPVNSASAKTNTVDFVDKFKNHGLDYALNFSESRLPLLERLPYVYIYP
ncbi:CHAT domain-containing protein [Planktomarina temperata]|nr:CHAT domain-containing protein [Planktomarina temperata]